MAPALWVMGDVHGALAPLRTLLRRAGLLALQVGPDREAGREAEGGANPHEDCWTGGDAQLVFLGDLLDRGPDGAGVLRLVRCLQSQAAAAGGSVECLLGNHEVMLLAALRFGRRGRGGRLGPGDPYGLFRYWQDNGGQRRDLERLEPGDLSWLLERPALLRAGHWLLLHADAPLYLTLGETLETANARVAALLHASTPEVWGGLMGAFSERGELLGSRGAALSAQLLGTFGGHWLAHGHTPVPLLWAAGEVEPEAPESRRPEVPGTEQPGTGEHPGGPFLYPHGQALGLDGGLAFQRGAGFIVRLDPQAGPAPLLTVPLVSTRG